jgi:hypothetical protein
MMAPWAMLDIAAIPGLSISVMAQLRPGARRLLRKIRTRMRSAGERYIISGLIRAQRRSLALRPSAFLRQGRQLRLTSRLLSCQTRRQHRRQRDLAQHRGLARHRCLARRRCARGDNYELAKGITGVESIVARCSKSRQRSVCPTTSLPGLQIICCCLWILSRLAISHLTEEIGRLGFAPTPAIKSARIFAC